MNLSELLEHDPSLINEAAIETDTTILELLSEIQAIREDAKIPVTGRAMHTYIWLLSKIEAMCEYVEEIESEPAMCGVCHGVGREAEAICCRCKGSGMANDADAAAEAEYRADMTQDDRLLKEMGK